MPLSQPLNLVRTRPSLRLLFYQAAFLLQLAALGIIWLNGKIISMLQTHAPDGYIWVAIYIGAYISYAIFNISVTFFEQRGAAEAFANAWTLLFPQKLQRAHEGKASDLFLTFTDHVPKLFSLKMRIHSAVIQSLTFFAFMAWQSYMSGLVEMLVIVPIALLTSVTACHFTARPVEAVRRDVYRNVQSVARWLNDYFTANREISANWRQNTTLWQWRESRGLELLGKHSQLIGRETRRHIILLFCHDGLFALMIGLVFLRAFRGELSVAETVVWLGVINHFSRATALVNTALTQHNEFKTLKSTVAETLHGLTPEIHSIPQQDEICRVKSVDLTLRDGSTMHLGTEPGLYLLHARNGAGKTTLVDTILGYTSFKLYEKNVGIIGLKSLGKMARVVAPNPVIFEGMPDINHQASGPNAAAPIEQLPDAMQTYLSRPIREAWRQKFLALAKSWHTSTDATKDIKYVLSSGEKAVLGMARVFSHFNAEVKLLIADEAEQNLDDESRCLYWMTLQELAKHIPIYCITHDPHIKQLTQEAVC